MGIPLRDSQRTGAALDDFNLHDLLFFKMDVEAYEPKVIQGALNTINNNKPYIMMEVHLNKSFHAENAAIANEKLISLGYSVVKKIGRTEKDWLYAPD